MAGPIVVDRESTQTNSDAPKENIQSSDYWSDFADENIEYLSRVVDNYNNSKKSGNREDILSSERQLALDTERIFRLAEGPEQIKRINQILEKKDSADLSVDQPKGGSVFKGNVADLKEDEKIGADKASAFFSGSDTKPGTTKVDVKKDDEDSGQDITTVSPDAAVDDSGFTIDPKKEEKPRERLDWKKLFGDNQPGDISKQGTESGPKPPLKKTEQVFLMSALRQAIDHYNKLIAQTVRVEEDLESKAADKKITDRYVLKSIREATHPSTNIHVSRRRLEALAGEIEDKATREEMQAFGQDIEGIEPAREETTAALETLLERTDDPQSIERLRLSLDDLVNESDLSKGDGEFQRDLKADLDAICENRKVDIYREPKVSPEIINEIDEIVAKHGASQSKSKIDDRISVGSAGLARKSEEEDQEKEKPTDEQVVSESVNQLSVGDKGQDSSEVSDLFKSKPADYVPKTTEPNIYEEIATESATAVAEGSDVTEEKPKESSSVVIPPKPAEPLVKTDKINEFVQIDKTGIPISADLVEHEEVVLSPKEGLTPEQLADLTGKTDEDVEGVVNLKSSDLVGKVELPRHADNQKVEIQKRLAELRARPQVQVDPDIFGEEESKVTDVTGKPLNETAVTTEAPPMEDVSTESATIPEPITDGKIVETEATPPERGVPTDDGGKIESETVKKAEAGTSKADILDTGNAVETGPDLVEEKTDKKGEVTNIQAQIPESKPVSTKKVKLFERLKQIVGLGDNINSKNAGELDKIVAAERNNTVAKIAEQKK